MKAIYSFKKLDYYYKPYSEEFFEVARLSVKAAKKYYSTKIYCDNASKEMFDENGIEFDEVVIVEDFIHDYPDLTAIMKVYAAMNETEPYVLLDLDTVLLQEPVTTNTITYGHLEVTMEDSNTIVPHHYEYIYNYYAKPFLEHAESKFDPDELWRFDWTVFPNTCLVVVKNPTIISYIYKEIFSRFTKEEINKLPMPLLEQFLVHQFIVMKEIDFGYFYRRHHYSQEKFDALKLFSKKYVHLDINREFIKEEIEYFKTVV